MPNNYYVNLAREALKKTNILPPTSKDANLIVKASYGKIIKDSGNNLIPANLLELKFRVREDKRPSVIYEDANPELTNYIKGQSVEPILLPDWVYPGQQMEGTYNNKKGIFIISNRYRNPHGIHDIVGDKITGRFILNRV